MRDSSCAVVHRLADRLCAALFRTDADPVHPCVNRLGHAGSHGQRTATLARRALPSSQDGLRDWAVRNLFQFGLVEQAKFLQSEVRADPGTSAGTKRARPPKGGTWAKAGRPDEVSNHGSRPEQEARRS